MSTPTSSSASIGPLVGIFPPAWRLGERWGVVCQTKVPKADMPTPDPPLFEDIVFRMRVTEIPNGQHQFYKLEAIPEPGPTGYLLSFRTDPFSLASFERLREGQREAGRDNGPLPFIARTPDRLVLDFPVMPTSDRIFRASEFEIDDKSFTQTVEPTSDGIRITLESESYRIVFLWKKGQPWWSSVERSYTPLFRDKVDRTFAGSGRLLP